MILRERLKAFHRDAYKAVVLPGDASTRRYYRLHPRSANDDEMSLILMSFEGPARIDDTDKFVTATDLFQSVGCPVPEIVYISRQEGFIVQQDLGDTTLESTAGKAVHLYERALEVLLRLQRGSGKFRDVYPEIFARQMDAARIEFELEFFKTNGLELNGPLLSREERIVEKAFSCLAGCIDPLPRTLNHRDYHSRNIMFVRGEDGDDIAVVDYQDALMASPFYDAASLLRDSYVELPQTTARNLLEGYLGEANRAGIPLPAGRSEAVALFDLVALQRNIKALGTFAHQGVGLGKSHFLSSIPKSLDLIRANPEGKRPALSPLVDLVCHKLGGLG